MSLQVPFHCFGVYNRFVLQQIGSING